MRTTRMSCSHWFIITTWLMAAVSAIQVYPEDQGLDTGYQDWLIKLDPTAEYKDWLADPRELVIRLPQPREDPYVEYRSSWNSVENPVEGHQPRLSRYIVKKWSDFSGLKGLKGLKASQRMSRIVKEKYKKGRFPSLCYFKLCAFRPPN